MRRTNAFLIYRRTKKLLLQTEVFQAVHTAFWIKTLKRITVDDVIDIKHGDLRFQPKYYLPDGRLATPRICVQTLM